LPRASNHANRIANGKLTSTLRSAMDKLKRKASSSKGVSIKTDYREFADKYSDSP
jgi:hypothetical protein